MAWRVYERSEMITCRLLQGPCIEEGELSGTRHCSPLCDDCKVYIAWKSSKLTIIDWVQQGNYDKFNFDGEMLDNLS